MKRILQWIACMLIACAAAVTGKANVYTVTSTVDNASAATTSGTLRWAITQANARAGKDSVYFSILPGINYFETSGPNSFAVIQLYDSLPSIRDSLLIDGTTQPKSNFAVVAGKTVGVDAIVQANFIGPDVYIVPSNTFVFPNGSASSNNQGSGLTISNNDVTIKRLALSGFGNTSTNASAAQANACISVTTNPTASNCTISIQDCFLGADPTGAYPTLSYRQTLGQGIFVQANRHYGFITHNYIAWAGVNGINLNCAVNTPASPTYPVIRGWTIQDNYILHPSNNTTLNSATNVCDAASCLGTPRLTYQRNYIEDTYQTALDLGHNGDTSLVENNTITGTVRAISVLPQAGIRVTASCRAVVLQKNVIYNNTSSLFTGGIYIDGVKTSIANASTYNTANNTITLNNIHDNKGSGIVISNLNSSGGVTTGNLISQNSTYNNAGLGIDLGLANTSSSNGTTSVTINDDGDPDAGANTLQNFPILDSATITGFSLTVYGKGPAGATIEFFTCDGGINKFPSYTLNYGEGKNYLATGTEGSGADLASGVVAYSDVDGNSASTTKASKFQFVFTLTAAQKAAVSSLDSLTSTATLAGNTSEFGPQAIKFTVLSCQLLDLSGTYANRKTSLTWTAICDQKFNYFDVEFSSDGTHFSPVGRVPANYNNNQRAVYEFEYSGQGSAVGYYRLKIVDKQGNYRYSNSIIIRIRESAEIIVGPNPASDFITVTIPSAKADVVQLTLFNALGSVLVNRQETLRAGSNVFTLQEPAQLSPGTYALRIARGDEVVSRQVIIRK